MRKILIICLLMLSIALPTFAQDWIQTSEKSYMDYDSIELYINDYGKEQQNKFCYWIKVLNNNNELFKNIEKISNKKVHYYLCKSIIDIKTKRLAQKYIVIYDINGKSIYSHETQDYSLEWQSIVPDTVGDVELEIVKDYIKKQ